MRPKCRYLPAASRGNYNFVERKLAFRGARMCAPSEAGRECVQSADVCLPRPAVKKFVEHKRAFRGA